MRPGSRSRNARAPRRQRGDDDGVGRRGGRRGRIDDGDGGDKRAIETRATPSTISSMVMTRRLSAVSSPKPATTPRVAKRWAIPHRPVKAAAT